MQPSRDAHPLHELISEMADDAVGIGMFTMALFPFAIPALALTVVLILPLLLASLACVLLAAPALFAVRGPSSPEGTAEMSR